MGFNSVFLDTRMFSAVVRSGIRLQTVRQLTRFSASRFYATKTDSDKTEASKKEEKALDAKKEDAPIEKTSSKKDAEVPDFPEYPQIRADFEAGVRSRDYLKTIPKQKRIDLLQQKPGSVVYFDDEEFKHYFPHECFIAVRV